METRAVALALLAESQPPVKTSVAVLARLPRLPAMETNATGLVGCQFVATSNLHFPELELCRRHRLPWLRQAQLVVL